MSPAFLIVCLSLVQACIAPAVSCATANRASSILDTSFSFTSSESTPNTCNELDKCRSLVSIVTSCLATIFACIWVAVHPNMPGPKQSWLSKQIESFKLVVVTLLVPEWVLAWAVRQFLQAREYGKMLEVARLAAAGELASQVFRKNKNFHRRLRYTINERNDWGNVTDSFLDNQRGEPAAAIWAEERSVLPVNWTKDHIGGMGKVTKAGLNDERTKLACRRYLDATEAGPEDLALANAVLLWTTAHGFLAIMGGFYYYQNGKPMFPLQVHEVSGWDSIHGDPSHYILALVKSRSLVPPTSDELGDRSKGDTLSKTIAVFQTLWFVAQCIARRIGNLAITNLEIMTLAYTVITVALYAAWWHKPLNVRCPIRVKGNGKTVKNPQPFEWTSRNILFYVIGQQDNIFLLSGEERVPTFWSSCSSGAHTTNGDIPLFADIVTLMVAMVFGAVHCTAWSYVFPSLAEQWMWRVCAIAIAAIPLPMAAAFAVSNPFYGRPGYIIMFCMVLGALLYISARMILLVLAFTTLRHLPPSAFQIVQWTAWIPHI